MAYQLVALKPLIITSSGSTLTNAVYPCGDAECLVLTVASTVASTSGYRVEISLLDPLIASDQQSASTAFFPLTVAITSSGAYSTGALLIAPGVAHIIDNPTFHQLRLMGSSGAETSGTIVGYAAKKIFV